MNFKYASLKGERCIFFRIMEIIVKKLYLSFCCFFITHSTYAITPAKKGINVPLYLVEEFKQIRSEYSSGYWPQEMAVDAVCWKAAMENSWRKHQYQPAFVCLCFSAIIVNSQQKYTRQDFQNDLFDSNPKGNRHTILFWNLLWKDVSHRNRFGLGRCTKTLLYYAGTNGQSNDGRRDFVIDLLFSIDPTFDFSPYVDPTSLDYEDIMFGLLLQFIQAPVRKQCE